MYVDAEAPKLLIGRRDTNSELRVQRVFIPSSQSWCRAWHLFVRFKDNQNVRQEKLLFGLGHCQAG